MSIEEFIDGIGTVPIDEEGYMNRMIGITTNEGTSYVMSHFKINDEKSVIPKSPIVSEVIDKKEIKDIYFLEERLLDYRHNQKEKAAPEERINREVTV